MHSSGVHSVYRSVCNGNATALEEVCVVGGVDDGGWVGADKDGRGGSADGAHVGRGRKTEVQVVLLVPDTGWPEPAPSCFACLLPAHASLSPVCLLSLPPQVEGAPPGPRLPSGYVLAVSWSTAGCCGFVILVASAA